MWQPASHQGVSVLVRPQGATHTLSLAFKLRSDSVLQSWVLDLCKDLYQGSQ